MLKLNFCIETDSLALMMKLLEAMPSLQGRAAYAEGHTISTCEMFLTDMQTDDHTEWFAGYVREARNGVVEAKFRDKQFLFRAQDLYCLSLSAKLANDEPVGWSLSVSATMPLMQILLDVIEVNASDDTTLTQDGNATTTGRLREVVESVN